MREKKKRSERERARECLWANLTKGCSGIPGSGIPSDWSILTDFCQHESITDEDEIYDMAAVRDLSTSNAVFKQICYKQQANRFPQVKCLPEEQKDCIKIWSMKDSFAILPTVFDRV